MKKILLTGAAGFIGSKTAELLLDKGYQVIGLDNLNDYYDPALKKHRLEELKKSPRFHFQKVDIENFQALKKVFAAHKFDAVVNLAARAGVRYSLENPFVYLRTNTMGTLNLLELCKDHKISKFVLASTSSLYASEALPFKESYAVNKPISPYAATKKGAEAMCYAYHHYYGIDVTVLRYFTVYGPAGRPDMSYFKFMRAIDEGKPIVIYGDGLQIRDFTYVEDIARGTVAALKKVKFETVNLGGSRCHKLIEMVRILEECLGKKAKIRYVSAHKADMEATMADTGIARKKLGWKARVGLREGLEKTVEWYLKNKRWVSRLKNVKS